MQACASGENDSNRADKEYVKHVFPELPPDSNFKVKAAPLIFTEYAFRLSFSYSSSHPLIFLFSHARSMIGSM